MYLTTTNKLIIVLAVIVLLIAVFFSTRVETCSTFACFKDHLTQCKPAKYTSEENRAAYEYFVKGKTQGQCEVDVTLLLAREGRLSLDELEGLSMTCFYSIGFSDLPGKELDRCSGPLKEGMQSKIIKGLQEFLVGSGSGS